MTRPGDSSLIAIAITSIRGQRRTRTIVDRTTSMILFRNRPNQMADSARRPLSPSFELHSTNGSRSIVEQAGVILLSFHAGEEPVKTECRGLKSLHDVWNMDGLMSQPEACPLRSKILESMTDPIANSHFQKDRTSHLFDSNECRAMYQRGTQD